MKGFLVKLLKIFVKISKPYLKKRVKEELIPVLQKGVSAGIKDVDDHTSRVVKNIIMNFINKL